MPAYAADSARLLPPLALTMGDPAGIGPDITVLAWRDRLRLDLPPFVVFGDADVLAERARALGIAAAVKVVADVDNGVEEFRQSLPVVGIPTARPVVPGRADVANASAVIGAIDAAADAVAREAAAALVTNPIAKSVLTAAGFAHRGHTDYLAHLAERLWPGCRYHPVMMLASPELRVVPLTVHLPLSAVPGAVTRSLILTTARILHDALRRDFAIPSPRIAVAGLNPHAGENGTIGREERDIVAPAIAELNGEGLAIAGPYSADALFHAAARRGYDVVLAMYHDQALIPLKTLAFDRGVNVTLGLPFVRTSPDHGTAFDIAGRGTASPASLIAALRLAAELAARRRPRPLLARDEAPSAL
ncbi:MAG: 4-hydroxythreonine-4-phosphate dehydrogenase PdxA [Hyphomicrobiaceae bacterium]